jgi:hypothetical protein
MKSSKPNTIRRFVFLLSAIIVYALALLGCAIVTTSRAPEGNIEGIVYHLPASFLKVSIESKKDVKGNHSELVVAAGPEIVPDKKARLTLKPSGNPSFTRNHTFTFTNGLLSTIAIDDEGKSGEIITNLATTAINIVKFVALGVPSRGVDERESEDPLNEEITAALSSIAPGQHDFLFTLAKKSANVYLPGTAELLCFSAEIANLPSSRPEIGKADLDNFNGIATRVLEPYWVKVSLDLKRVKLYSNRISALSQRIAELQKIIAETPDKIKELQGKLQAPQLSEADKERLKKEIRDTERTLEDSQKDKPKAEKRKKENEDLRKKYPPDAGYRISDHSLVILIPDYSPIVKIPLTRAPLGKTKFSITLNRGILTDYKAEHPSTILEIVKVPLNISEAIVKLPTEILQLKIDYSSKEQALVEQQAKYQDTLKAIAEKIKGPSAYDEQVKALEQEKAILQLQNEIAELKAAISKLESP